MNSFALVTRLSRLDNYELLEPETCEAMANEHCLEPLVTFATVASRVEELERRVPQFPLSASSHGRL